MQVPKGRPRSGAGRVVDALLWMASLGLLGGTIAYSLGPAPAALNAFPLADKVLHAGTYGAMTLSWLLTVVWRPGRGGGAIPEDAPAVLVSAIILGATIEVAQHFVDRTADPLDALSDAVGAVAGLAVWAAVRRMTRHRARRA